MKVLGNLLMMSSLLIMVASLGAVVAILCDLSAPIWLVAAFPGAFIAGLAGKVFYEAA